MISAFTILALAFSFNISHLSDLSCTTMVPSGLAPVCELLELDKPDFFHKFGKGVPLFGLTEEQLAKLGFVLVVAGTLLVVAVTGTVMAVVRLSTYMVPRVWPNNETLALRIINNLADALAARGQVAHLAQAMPAVLPQAQAFPVRPAPAPVTPPAPAAPAAATPPSGPGIGWAHKTCRFCGFGGVVASAQKRCRACGSADALRTL